MTGRQPPWLRRTWRDRWNDRPRNREDAWHLLMELTFCKAGHHSAGGERKFNGGNPVRLCAHCRVIVEYERGLK